SLRPPGEVADGTDAWRVGPRLALRISEEPHSSPRPSWFTAYAGKVYLGRPSGRPRRPPGLGRSPVSPRWVRNRASTRARRPTFAVPGARGRRPGAQPVRPFLDTPCISPTCRAS